MKKAILAVTAIALGAGVLFATVPSVLAYRGDPRVKGPYYSEERHAAMEAAFEKKDFNAWKSLIPGKGRAVQIVNQDNFAKFAQAHELAEQGKFDEARQIRLELGLGFQGRMGR